MLSGSRDDKGEAVGRNPEEVAQTDLKSGRTVRPQIRGRGEGTGAVEDDLPRGSGRCYFGRIDRRRRADLSAGDGSVENVVVADLRVGHGLPTNTEIMLRPRIPAGDRPEDPAGSNGQPVRLNDAGDDPVRHRNRLGINRGERTARSGVCGLP